MDTLLNVERLRFADKTVAFDINGDAGQVYRTYKAAFDRTPDSGGLKFWISNMDKGVTLEQVATGFLSSPEFQTLYGANPSADQFVSTLYNNVLHRAPEPSGFNFWVNVVSSGVTTKAQALAAFAESPENQAAVVGIIQNGIELI